MDRPQKPKLVRRILRASLRHRACAVFLFLLLGLIVYCIRSAQDQTQHKGKPIRYWVNRACASEDEREAFQEIKTIGAPAVPYLMAKLRAKDSYWDSAGAAYNRLLIRLPRRLASALPSYSFAGISRHRAGQCLVALGPSAKSAAVDLARLMVRETREPDIIAESNALLAIGPEAKEAVPLLRDTWRSKTPLGQAQFATVLFRIGSETNLALEIFTNCIASRNSGAAAAAAYCLAEFGPVARPAIPGLIGLLQDAAEWYVARRGAAYSLGRIGVANRAVTSALVAGTNSPNSEVAGDCALALWRLDVRYIADVLPIVVRFAVQDLRWSSFAAYSEKSHLDLTPVLPALRRLAEETTPAGQAARATLRELGELK